MKTINSISIIASIAISLTTSHADVTFSAPGLANPYTTAERNVQLLLQTAPTSKYWKYKITGYEYEIQAAPQSGGSTFLGTSIKVMVNNQVILHEVFQPTNSSGTGLVSVTLSSPIIITNKEIITSLTYNTDMVGGNDHVRLIGEAVVAPPEPTGSLKTQALVAQGGSPTLHWTITKSPSSAVVVAEIPQAVFADGAGADIQKTNHGHGNNLDGIDGDNPGNAATVWQDDSVLLTDGASQLTNGVDNDEAGGGSKSVSKTKASK
jgi:hypothetical protein